MPQISLYIDEETLKKIEQSASQERVSISKWVAERIRSSLSPEYPVGFADLFGSVSDATFSRPKTPSLRADSRRGKL